MIYAQFWHKGLSGGLIPACGSDAVLVLDGRFGRARLHAAARERLAQPFFARKYDAYTLHAGDRFTSARCLMLLPALPAGGVVDAAAISPAYLDSRGRVANC